MVRDRLRDGTRVAQLLASEIEGHERSLARFEVADANPDVDPAEDGALGYAVERDGERVAEVYVHPDHARVVFSRGGERVRAAAADANLAVLEEDGQPAVLVTDGAEVKRAVAAFEAL